MPIDLRTTTWFQTESSVTRFSAVSPCLAVWIVVDRSKHGEENVFGQLQIRAHDKLQHPGYGIPAGETDWH